VAEAERPQVLSWTLVGQPAAWIVGMPLVGALGEVSWRLGWLALPLTASVVAVLLLLRRQAEEDRHADDPRLRPILSDRPIARWAVAEFLFNCGWAGTLVYTGTLFAKSYAVSSALTGLLLGGGAAVYIAGTLASRRLARQQPHQQLVALALLLAIAVTAFCSIRTSFWTSAVLFAAAAFVAGARTFVGNAVGLAVPPDVRLAVMGVRTAAVQVGSVVGVAVAGLALAIGGYPGLGAAMAALFVGAAGALVDLRVTVAPFGELGEA
jgi:DHA1 family inner membrane transport protein